MDETHHQDHQKGISTGRRAGTAAASPANSEQQVFLFLSFLMFEPVLSPSRDPSLNARGYAGVQDKSLPCRFWTAAWAATKKDLSAWSLSTFLRRLQELGKEDEPLLGVWPCDTDVPGMPHLHFGSPKRPRNHPPFLRGTRAGEDSWKGCCLTARPLDISSGKRVPTSNAALSQQAALQK